MICKVIWLKPNVWHDSFCKAYLIIHQIMPFPIYLSYGHDMVHDSNGLSQIEHLKGFSTEVIAMVSPYDPSRGLNHVFEGVCQNRIYFWLLKHFQGGAIIIVIVLVIM